MILVDQAPPRELAFSEPRSAAAHRWTAGKPPPAKSQLRFSSALFLADILALCLAVPAAILVAIASDDWDRAALRHSMGPSLLQGALPLLVLASLAVLAFLASHSHYDKRIPFWTELRDLLFASAAALLLSSSLGVLLHHGYSQSIPVVTWLAFPLLALASRKFVRGRLRTAGLWQIRTMVVSAPAGAPQTIAALQSEPQLGYEVVAVINPDQATDATGCYRWRALMRQHGADLLILSYDGGTAPARVAIESLVRDRVAFAVMPQFEGLPVLGFEQTSFFSHDTVMFTFRNNLAQPLARLTKLAFDVAAASVGLVLLAPLLAILTLLVKLDGGPAFYGHTRVGSGGRPFRCLKFRSMVVDSEAALLGLLARDPDAAAEWAETCKLVHDPRITKIGRILRSTSLDELPQLFNVLRLEMSLVGPRPIIGAEVPRYGDDIAYYYEARPGLTGLWQVSGRTETSYVQRVQLDTWYVKNWSIWHDLAILAKTVPAVLQRRGAQ